MSEFNNVEAEERLRLHKAHADMLEQQNAALASQAPVAQPPAQNSTRPSLQSRNLANRSAEEQLDLLTEELNNLKRRAGNESRSAVAFTGNGNDDFGQPGRSELQNIFSFDRVVSTVVRSWKQIILFAVAGAVLATLYAVSLPNRFESVAEILLEPRGLKVLNNSVSPNGLSGDATVAFAASQVRIMYSSSVIDPVVDDLELAEDPEFNGSGSGSLIASLKQLMVGSGASSTGRPAAKRHLMKNLNVQRFGQSFSILVGVSTADPEKSARIANALARSYIDDESGARSTVARSANEDLTARLDDLRKQVRINEENVQKYKVANGLVDANGRLVSAVQLERLNEQLVLAKVQTGDTKTRANMAAKADLADVVSGSLPPNLTSATVNQLRLDYSRANARLERLKTKLGARHPDRIAAESERRSALNAIAAEMKRMVQSAQEEFKRAVARQNDLTAQVNQLKGAAVNDSAAMVKLRELNRQVEASRQIYESVLLRSRETGAEQSIRASSARIISEAVPTYEKSGPNRKVFVAAGVIVGAALGTMFVLVPFVWLGLQQLSFGGRRRRSSAPPSL
ncbi:MAG: GumC family protein, partial [Rhizobiaceae bacterium]